MLYDHTPHRRRGATARRADWLAPLFADSEPPANGAPAHARSKALDEHQPDGLQLFPLRFPLLYCMTPHVDGAAIESCSARPSMANLKRIPAASMSCQKLAVAGWTDRAIGESSASLPPGVLSSRGARLPAPTQARRLSQPRRRHAAGQELRRDAGDCSSPMPADGHGILEFDHSTGLEQPIDAFPSPEELWNCYRAANGLDEALEDKLLVPNHSLRADPALLPGDRHQPGVGGDPLRASSACC